MNSGKGVFDPYRSFIEISVITDPVSMPVGLLQVDNSAHSFINQIVLYSICLSLCLISIIVITLFNKLFWGFAKQQSADLNVVLVTGRRID